MKLFDLAIPVTILLLVGPYSLTTQELDSVLKVSKSQFREGGFRLRPKIRVRKDPLPPSTLATWKNDYWKTVRSVDKKGLVVAVRGPIIDTDGTRYVAGRTQTRCGANNVAVLWAQAKSSVDGSSRIYQSGVAISHELGHAHNVSHQTNFQVGRDGPTIMNADAGNISVSQPLHFSWPEAGKIRECLCSRICRPGDINCEVERCIYGG